MAHSPTPEVPRQKEPEKTNVPLAPIQIVRVMPVQPVVVRDFISPAQTYAPLQGPKPIREEPNSLAPEPRIEPPNNSKNSDNSKKPNETIELFERIGKVGRQRKYEEKGNRGENSVRDVVLYRHIRGRHYPGLSNDMRRWYEFFYFKSPMRGEKQFNANTTYEQHVEAYERGRDWIKRYETTATGALGHSRIVDLQARRAAN